MSTRMKESKTFDTSNVKGLESAERYKQKLETKYDRVVTTPVGLDRVRIEGCSRIQERKEN